MGKSLDWVVLSKNLNHNQTKVLCIGLECKLKMDVVLLKIKEKLLENNMDCSLAIEYYSHGNVPSSDWCEKCSLFIHGPMLYDEEINDGMNPLVIDNLCINHSSSNDYWDSIYSIDNLVIQKKNHNIYSGEDFEFEIIDYSDVVKFDESILIAPRNDKEKYHYKETKEITDFLKKWSILSDKIVLFSS